MFTCQVYSVLQLFVVKTPEVNPTILFSETGDGSFRSSVLQIRLLAYASRTKQVKRCELYCNSTIQNATIEPSLCFIILPFGLNFLIAYCITARTCYSWQAALGFLLFNAAFGQHNNPLCVPDGGQPMRYDNGCTVCSKSLQRILNHISLSLSSELVVLSKIRMGGFFRKTLAMLILCFCHPDSFYAALTNK